MARRPDTSAAAPILIANGGSELYGSDRMLLETVAALVDCGEQVLVTVPEPGPLTSAISARGAEPVIMPTPVLRKAILRPAGMVRFVDQTVRAIGPSLRLLRHHRPKLVIVNTITPWLWLVAGRLSGTPVLCHVHEGEASVPRIVRIGLAAPLLLANRLIVNSQFSRDVLSSAIASMGRRSELIYNAVVGPEEPRPPRPTLDGPIRLLVVGRVSPRKGTHVAVDAVRILAEQGVDVHLDVVGGVFKGYEWFETELRATIEQHGLGAFVTFHGFCSDIWPFMAAADICLIPSTLDEPFGNTAVEAALAARPCVVSRTSGLLEASDGFASAVRVSPADPAQIAAAVTSISRSWEGYRLASLRDRDAARERYSPARYRAAIQQTVSRMVGHGPAGADRAVSTSVVSDHHER